MSRIIDINFNYLDNTVVATSAATLALDTRLGDCGGIRNRISSISSNTNNLCTANTYLDKKRNQLKAKRDGLRQFNKDVTSFGVFAKAQDIKAAASIYVSGHKFYHAESIAHGPLYTIAAVIGDGIKWLADKASKRIGALIEGAKKLWQVIKEFYEKNKYIIDVIYDALAIVVAVVTMVLATGPVAFAVAVWAVAKSVTSFTYDSMALQAYRDGDLETAEELNGKNLGDLMESKFGKLGKTIYHAANIAAFAYDVTEFAKNAKYLTSLKSLDSKWGDVLSPQTINEIKTTGKVLLVKMTTGIDFSSPNLQNTLKNIKAVFGAIKGFAENGWEEGAVGGLKITHDINDFFEDLHGFVHGDPTPAAITGGFR